MWLHKLQPFGIHPSAAALNAPESALLLLTLHPYGIPCQWALPAWMVLCQPVICVPAAGCACMFRPFFRLPKQDTAIQLEPDLAVATPSLPSPVFLALP